MFFYYEVTDAEGKRHGRQMNIPDVKSVADAKRHLTIQAHQLGYRDIEMFPENMPEHEIKKRIDAIEVANGGEPRFSDDEKKPRELQKTVVSITDHTTGQTFEQPISPQGPASLTVAHNAETALPQVDITQHQPINPALPSATVPPSAHG